MLLPVYAGNSRDDKAISVDISVGCTGIIGVLNNGRGRSGISGAGGESCRTVLLLFKYSRYKLF